MGRLQTLSADFARRGFTQAAAAARIWESWSQQHREAVDLALFENVGERFQALETLDQLRAMDLFDALIEDHQWCARVLKVAGASSGLAQTLRRSQEAVGLLAEPPKERDAAAWRAFFQARVPIIDGECRRSADDLRLTNRLALIVIAARDLSADDPSDIVESVALELSHVADNVLATSLALARAERPDWRAARLAVVALGKAGGQELNYLSDVDVIYVAEPAPGTDSDQAIRIATALAAAQARICSAHTKAGTIWSVDAGLRPEGKAGPLVRTLNSYKRYYNQWAENWEFQALLKARPVAGDLALGEEFVAAVSPLVWRAGQRAGFLPELRAMRQRVIDNIPQNQAEHEIKLTSGGLRDTEFSVQLLQLVHGRMDQALRKRGTLRALRALIVGGYIGRSDGTQLAAHYRFQRVLEHRAQLVNLRRTHLVPEDKDRLEQFARTGLPDALERWRTSRRDVRRLRKRIFFSPLLDTVASLPAEALLSLDAVKERLRALGFQDPRTALAHLQSLTAGTSRAAQIRRQLMPAMLEWIALGPNPDFGLLAFRQLSEALGEAPWYLRGLRDEGYMAKRLAKVASTSRFTVELLQRSPETVRLLASDEELVPRAVEELTASMRRSAARHENVRRAIESARSFRRSELCRIALFDVLGGVEIVQCGHALSALATAAVETALDVARREVAAPELGIIALGRWGGRELNYASDLDCMFVVADEDAAGIDAATELVRRVREILRQLGPQGLNLDSDLRPEGKGGQQVRTVSAYRSYYRKWASTWELQMLLRARHGAGSVALVSQVLSDIDQYRYPAGGLEDSAVREIRRLKSRMERERIPAGVDPKRHLKLGPGGLADIEWTVQLLQLRHAHDHPQLRTTATLAALDAARELSLINPGDAAALSAAWRHASTVRDAIMLVRGRASDTLPTDIRDLASIAALLGYTAAVTQLGETTRRHARLAGAVVNRLFWGD